MGEKQVKESLSMIYADAKTTTTLAVRNVMKAFPLPVFMFETILEGILLEIRAEAKMELSSEVQKYKEELLKQHEAEMEELRKQYESEKEELIRQFENPEVVTEAAYIGEKKVHDGDEAEVR